MRKERKVISEGDIKFIMDVPESVMCYKRMLGNEEMVVFGNMSGDVVEVPLGAELKNRLLGIEIVIDNYEESGTIEAAKVELKPYEFLVLGNVR
ncbi:MAG: hypothetical protein K5883_03350 [Pseudobutyrivibrio sp.]|nr:hypothetical protein [Pseudobutyrivibrio sp.]